jgi:hypothetical protein
MTMMSIRVLLQFVALVLFVCAALRVPSGRIDFTAAGLACWVGAALLV